MKKFHAMTGSLKMNARATVRLRLPSERHLATLMEALAPETKRSLNGRARAVLEREDDFVVLKVEAKDTVALRAALNAYLRWMGSTARVVEVVRQTS